MQRARSKTKAILSSSSSKVGFAVAALFALVTLGLGHSSHAGSRPHEVDVPVESFSRTAKPTPPLKGLLWRASRNETGKAVLLVHGSGERKERWSDYAKYLQALGYDVLAIDLRPRGAQPKKLLIEDVQSGVVFLKSEDSKPKIEARGVSIVGSSLGANAAVHYAGASPQNYHIIDTLVLLSPSEGEKEVPLHEGIAAVRGIPILLSASDQDKPGAEAVKKAKELCQTSCETLYYPSAGQGIPLLETKHGEELKKAIEVFLQSRNG